MRTDAESNAAAGIPQRLLVTGGTGFIGTHMCAQLLQRGHQLTVLDLHPKSSTPTGVRFVRGDVRDPAAVREAMDGVDGVLHLAAAHHDAGIATPTYFDVNEGSTKVIVDEMGRRGLRRICFYSSVAIYGSGVGARDEQSAPHADNPYGQSKWAAEQVLLAATAAGQVDALVIRPTVTFGPKNFANMFALIRQIDSGLFLRVGDGANIKSLSYVENLVDFTLWAWERHGAGFDAFNWVEAPDLSSDQISAKLAAALGKSLPAFRVPMSVALMMAAPFEVASTILGRSLPVSRARVRKLAADHTQFSSGKARAAGFVPRVSIDEAFARTVAWYRAEGRHVPREVRIPPATVVPLEQVA